MFSFLLVSVYLSIELVNKLKEIINIYSEWRKDGFHLGGCLSWFSTLFNRKSEQTI